MLHNITLRKHDVLKILFLLSVFKNYAVLFFFLRHLEYTSFKLNCENMSPLFADHSLYVCKCVCKRQSVRKCTLKVFMCTDMFKDSNFFLSLNFQLSAYLWDYVYLHV